LTYKTLGVPGVKSPTRFTPLMAWVHGAAMTGDELSLSHDQRQARRADADGGMPQLGWFNMRDETTPPENFVARAIREQLGAGRLEKLIQAQQALQAAIAHQGEQPGTMGGQLQPPQTSLGSQQPGTMGGQLQPPQTSLGSRVEPSLSFSPEVIPAIQLAAPELAEEIRHLSPQDAMLTLNLFMALMQVLQTLLTLYQVTHSQPPTQTQIVEIFNHTTNVFHQTTNIVTNMPPEHG
jgi:hypothetical protein